MQRSIQLFIGLLMMAAILSGQADARTWKDVTGTYTIDADLIGFDGETAILQRKSGELAAFPINKLSPADRDFLKSKAALETHDKNLGALQTWTTVKGLKLIGRIVDYSQREVTLQRRRGKLYVNDQLFGNLPEVYQKIVMGVVEHFEKFPVANRADLDRWILGLQGQPKTYKLDGVILEFENGDEYAIPFFLFTEKDRKLLAGGFGAWLKDNGLEGAEGDLPEYHEPDEHELRLQSLAAAYQQNEQINQQIAMMNLNLNAIQAGLTSAWEVTLYPVAGNPFPPRWVITMGRNSEVATQLALQQNPGFVAGPVRRVSR